MELNAPQTVDDEPPSMELSGPPSDSKAVGSGVSITDACVARLGAIGEKKGAAMRLRILVDSGGCSGFQYDFSLEERDKALGEDDRAFEQGGVQVVVDEVSMQFLQGATIDFSSELIGQRFVVSDNPNSEAACGCGVSFSPKMF